MAATQRGRTERNYLKITLSSGIPIKCRIYRGGPAGLGHCVRCGYFLEDVYFLDCRHTLCEQCFYAHTEYVCKVDNTKTVIKQGVKHTPVFPIAVHKIDLECPECREPQKYKNIKGHLEEMHPQSFQREEQHSLPKQQAYTSASFGKEHGTGIQTRQQLRHAAASPSFFGIRQSEVPAKKGEDTWQGLNAPVFHGRNASVPHQQQAVCSESLTETDSDMMTDDNSSDTSLEKSHHDSGTNETNSAEIVKCSRCMTALEASDLEEHQKSCCQDLVECHVCHEKIAEKSYDEHVQNHYEKVSMDNTGLNEHQDSCPESKVKCHRCGEIITAKKYDEHMDTHYGKHQGISNSAGPAVKGDLLTKGDAKKHVEKLLRESKERDERNKIRNEPPATNQTAISKPERDSEGRSENRKQDEPMRTPTPHLMQHDDEEDVKKRKEIMELKNRIKELERRLEDLESPLKALIKRLSEDQQQQRGPPRSTAL